MTSADIPYRLAVLGSDGLHLANELHITIPATASLGALLREMHRLRVQQLWIHPSAKGPLHLPTTPPAAGHPWYSAPDWDVSGEGRWWLRAGRGDQSITVAVLPWNTLDGRWTAFEGLEPAELCRTLLELSWALGTFPTGGPGHTGDTILRATLAPKLDRLGARLVAQEPPPPALGRERERDLVWMADYQAEVPALMDLMQPPYERYSFRAYDRNAQYLAVCSSLRVGVGEWRRTNEPFSPHTYGYWQCLIEGGYQPDYLPDPIPRTEAPRWYMTPTIELAISLGCRITIFGAYTWPQSTRLLDDWYARLRRARMATQGAARNAVKQVYTSTIGRFESRLWDRVGDVLFRPDLREAIVSLARCNLYRSLMNSAKHPVCVYVDEAVYLCAPDEPDPLPLGDTLGGYKLAAMAGITEAARSAWQRDRPVPFLTAIKAAQLAAI